MDDVKGRVRRSLRDAGRHSSVLNPPPGTPRINFVTRLRKDGRLEECRARTKESILRTFQVQTAAHTLFRLMPFRLVARSVNRGVSRGSRTRVRVMPRPSTCVAYFGNYVGGFRKSYQPWTT